MVSKKSLWILAALLILVVSAQAAPKGDYGDAPDGAQAYPGVVGRFPTLYNSTSGLIGGHALTVGEEMIGTAVSAETDASDPSDPDGTPNIVDSDNDDTIYTQIASGTPPKARFIFKVRVADRAQEGERYINALVDFDKNGTWAGGGNMGEWVVKNQKIDIPPGATQLVKTDWFNWGCGATMPTPVWARIVLTREPIVTNNWMGEGEFKYGEVQDFLVELKGHEKNVTNRVSVTKLNCGNNKKEGAEECDGADDKACPGKCRKDCRCPKKRPDGELPTPGGGPSGQEPTRPGISGPRVGPCGTPVSYHALVINAGDKPKNCQGMKAADDIFEMLGEQRYDSRQYLAPYWDGEVGNMPDDGVTRGGWSSLEGIENAIKNLGKKAKCADRVMIYIVGHGLDKGGAKYGKTWPTGGIILNGKKGAKEVLTPEQLDEWLSKYLPACSNEDCKTPEKSCHVSVVIESCHSGNFLGPLSERGRTVAVSCASNEVSFFGRDDSGNLHGGDYTIGYVGDMSSLGTADTDKDGYVSVAEAHASAKAKLTIASKNGKKQTPEIKSEECDCLPLVCAPKCPNKIVDPGEECDPTAVPTGCPSGQKCEENCTCSLLQTPQSCPKGEHLYQTECKKNCQDGACTINEQTSCWICVAARRCPPNRYTQEECEQKRDPYQTCIYDKPTDCWYLQNTCNRGEYVDENCNEECGREDCIMVDRTGPCYACGSADDICARFDEYPTQSDCNADCGSPDYCAYNDGTKCWKCVSITNCGERGMYAKQSDCNADCDEPDYCAFNENYDCWYCQRVRCNPPLHNEPDCGGDCDSRKGEVCTKQEFGCYLCACPDLYIPSMAGQVSKHASTHCTGGEGVGCTTTCSLTATVSFQTKNAGSAIAGASTTRVDVSPGVGSQTASVESLSPGITTSTKTITLEKSGIVTGTSEACSTLDWWATTYTISATADSGRAVAECNENNNQNSGQTSSQ